MQNPVTFDGTTRMNLDHCSDHCMYVWVTYDPVIFDRTMCMNLNHFGDHCMYVWVTQDPVIFDGTIRMNLNPLGGHSDDQVWTALQQAHLSSYVRSLPDGLDHVCGEGGENLR